MWYVIMFICCFFPFFLSLRERLGPCRRSVRTLLRSWTVTCWTVLWTSWSPNSCNFSSTTAQRLGTKFSYYTFTTFYFDYKVNQICLFVWVFPVLLPWFRRLMSFQLKCSLYLLIDDTWSLVYSFCVCCFLMIWIAALIFIEFSA